MPSRPNKISVPQKLTFAASIDLPKSDANSLEKVLDLFRDSQTFLIDLGLDCLITLWASTADSQTFYHLEISNRIEIILTASFSQNGRKIEALHRFFVRNGFKSSIHFGGECLRSPVEINSEISGEAQYGSTRLMDIDDLSTLTVQTLEQKFSVSTVGELRQRCYEKMVAVLGEKHANAIIDELKQAGLPLPPGYE